MVKYIDVELLRKDINNLKTAMTDAVGEYSDGVRFALEHFTFVLDSLQQEQPKVNLDEEIDMMDDSVPCRKEDIEYIARHFYELGLNARKEESK